MINVSGGRGKAVLRFGQSIGDIYFCFVVLVLEFSRDCRWIRHIILLIFYVHVKDVHDVHGVVSHCTRARISLPAPTLLLSLPDVLYRGGEKLKS